MASSQALEMEVEAAAVDLQRSSARIKELPMSRHPPRYENAQDSENASSPSSSSGRFITQMSPSAYRSHSRQPLTSSPNRQPTVTVERVSQRSDADSKLGRRSDRTSGDRITSYIAEVPTQIDDARRTNNGMSQHDHQATSDSATSVVQPADTVTVVNGLSNWRPGPDASGRTENFARWRSSRYVPRYLTKVPKDQLKLLESERRWQRPMPGSHECNVPSALLKLLTDAANEPDPGIETSNAEKQKDHELPLHNVRSESQATPDIDRNSGNDEDGSQHVVEWDTSPPRSKQLSPQAPNHGHDPDSSPLSSSPESTIDQQQDLPSSSPTDPANVNRVGDTKMGQQDRNAEQEVLDPSLSSDVKEEVKSANELITELDATHGPREADHGNLGSTISSSGLRAEVSECGTDEPGEDNAALGQTAVQVKRTPYPPKPLLRADVELTPNADVESSGVELLPSSIVVGTFDEVAARAVSGSHRANSLVKPTAGLAKIEDNSSDDDYELPQQAQTHPRKSLSGTPKVPEAETTRHESATLTRHASQRSPPATHLRITRGSEPCATSKAADDRVSTPSNSTSPDGHTFISHRISSREARFEPPHAATGKRKRSNDTDFDGIGSMIRTYRRGAFGQIGIKPREICPSKSQQTRNSMIESVQSEPETGSGSALSPTSHLQQASTPFTVPSSLNQPRLPQAVSCSAPEIHPSHYISLAGVFSEYKHIYPKYNGDLLQFTNACQLIKSLKSEGRAPHSYLWDDFIYRLVGDYRQYIAEVLVAGGSVKEYAAFYQECVEEPEYVKRVVRVADIESLPLEVRRDSSRASLPHSTPADEPTQHSSLLKDTRSLVQERGPVPVSSTSPVAIQGHQNNVRPLPSSQKNGDAALSIAMEPSQNTPVRQSPDTTLDRHPGLSSPELGTPDGLDDDNDVEMLHLTADVVASQKDENEPMHCRSSRTRQTLPWNTVSSVPPDSPQLPCPPPLNNAVCETPNKAATNSLMQPPLQSQSRFSASKSLSGSRPQFTPSPGDLAVPTRIQDVVTCHSDFSPSPTKQYHKPRRSTVTEREWWQDEATPFKHYVRSYNNLPSETFDGSERDVPRDKNGSEKVHVSTNAHASGGVNAYTRRMVDIFAWRS